VLITPSVSAPVHAAADDAGMLFRTIPSATTESFAIASHIGAGARVALAYYSDDDNRAARDSLAIALADIGSELVVSERITPSMRSGAGLVAKLRDADPDVVVLSSPANRLEQNTAVLAALAEAGLAGDSLWLSSQNLVSYGDKLPDGALEGARGIRSGAQPDDDFIARVRTADPTVTDFRFAAEAYDAVILAALAAIAARDDAGVSIAAELRAVSSGGIACASFGECREVLTTAKKFDYDIDYVGVSGALDLDASGAPVTGNHRVYRYDSANAPLPASD
jgi:branched-chain amino acid transport system substrate-binding protein